MNPTRVNPIGAGGLGRDYILGQEPSKISGHLRAVLSREICAMNLEEIWAKQCLIQQ